MPSTSTPASSGDSCPTCPRHSASRSSACRPREAVTDQRSGRDVRAPAEAPAPDDPGRLAAARAPSRRPSTSTATGRRRRSRSATGSPPTTTRSSSTTAGAGYFQQTPDPYADLGELVGGQKPGRERADERTMAMNLGLALDDMAVAPEVYRRARARGRGTWLRL